MHGPILLPGVACPLHRSISHCCWRFPPPPPSSPFLYPADLLAPHRRRLVALLIFAAPLLSHEPASRGASPPALPRPIQHSQRQQLRQGSSAGKAAGAAQDKDEHVDEALGLAALFADSLRVCCGLWWRANNHTFRVSAHRRNFRQEGQCSSHTQQWNYASFASVATSGSRKRETDVIKTKRGGSCATRDPYVFAEASLCLAQVNCDGLFLTRPDGRDQWSARPNREIGADRRCTVGPRGPLA